MWAGAMSIAFLAVGAARRDPEALAFGVVTIVAGALTLVRKGFLGRLGLTLLALDTIGWMAPAALANVRSGEPIVVAGVPVVLAVLALGVLLLAANVPPAVVLACGVVCLGAGLGGAVVAGRGSAPIVASGRRISMRDVRFTPSAVDAAAGSELRVRNRDLFWHTFTIKGEGINARVPTGATRIVRIGLPPGTYEFVCAIPGHEQAGMTGTLTVVLSSQQPRS